MMTKFTVMSVMTLMMTLQSAWGHGMMLEPPQRSSMWRFGFPDSPANFNDNELFCGGFATQWNVHGGKCGICGDNYGDPAPRDNEAGGKYATGVIVRSYQRGDVINVTVMLTANHLGFFVFKLCANNDVTKPATQECLDQNVLKVIGPEGQDLGFKYFIDSDVGDKHIKLQLPIGLTCTQCVLQWTYNTANNWDCNNDNMTDCCVGCGPQENFVNCADIAIVGSLNGSETTKAPVVTTPAPPPPAPPTEKPATTASTSVTESCTCRPTGVYATQENMIFWCCFNCPRGLCPVTHYACS